MAVPINGSIAAPASMPARAIRPKTLPLDLASYLARESRLARGEAGVSGSQLARQLGTQQSRIARIEQAHEPHQYNVRDLAKAPRPLAMRMLRAVAALHGAQVVSTPKVTDTCHHVRSATVTRELCEVVTGYSTASADGRIDTSEAESLLRAVYEARAVLAELEQALVAEMAHARGEG